MPPTVLILISILIICTGSVRAEDWNMWGKDAGHTSYTGDSLEPPLKVLWSFNLGSPSIFGHVQPVVTNNVLYTNGITLEGEDAHLWHFALDADTGELLWKYEADDDSSRIAAFNDMVIVSDGEGIYGISNGKEKWRYKIRLLNGNPPIIYRDLIFSGQVLALYPGNGSLAWEYKPELPADDNEHLVDNYALPFAAGEDMVVLAIQSIKTCYTGQKVPTVIEKPGQTIPLYPPRFLAFARQNPDEPPQNISTIIIALDAKTGREEWIKRVAFTIEGPLIISKGTLFISSNGSVQAYLLKDGSELWRTPLPSFSIARAVKDKALFVDELYGWNITALNIDDGRILWTSRSSLDFRSLIIAGNILYIGGNSSLALLEALNATTGDIIWRGARIKGCSSASKPVVSGGKLFIVTQDGRLYAFSHGKSDSDERIIDTEDASSLSATISVAVLLGAFIILRREKFCTENI